MGPVGSLRGEIGSLRANGRGPILATVAGGWGMLLGARMIYPVLLPYLRSSFDLSLTVAGLLVTVLWLGSALGQLPGGVLADRYSERLVMAVGAAVVALALCAVIAAPTAAVLFLATGLVGVGQSLYPIARITILSKIYPDRIGSALGVTMATGDLGQTVLPPIAGALAAAIAWQAGLGFLVPLLLVAAIALWVVLPAQRSTGTTGETLSADHARHVLAELRRSNMAFVAFILFLYILIWQSFTGLYPTYLVDEKELSSTTAGLLFSGFFAVGVLVKPLAGAAYDRIGIRRSLVAVLVGPIAGLALLPVVEGFWALAGITALVSTMLGSGAITQSFLSDAIPQEIRGTGLGVVRTSAATLGAAGPVAFGAIADRGFFNEGYLLLAAIMALVVLLTLRLPDE
ncbi:Major Facilitator Superfamily protein [Halopenitus malekzadehii]|uniref:Major Facilitator Superfamily protein n=1 Tax=Halopenitus malekzadehii TaxID=1267564 RepID=A0A1H6J0U5_9EURY|nr:MFS transporter [Halopenitus malekzadehii]SEH55169.1 Major Facilitator Superfamily protein [Halopenitus malekzadehii]